MPWEKYEEPKRRCHVCGRPVAIRQDGTLRTHPARKNHPLRCAGSRKAPGELITGIRTRQDLLEALEELVDPETAREAERLARAYADNVIEAMWTSLQVVAQTLARTEKRTPG